MVADRTATTGTVNIREEGLFVPNIKVIGLGGGGSNAVDRMMSVGIAGVEYLVANTDCQALSRSHAPVRLQLGPRVTRGLGAGGKAEAGQEAANESRENLRRALAGADLVFIAAGLGGGTGTGAAPVVANIAREAGALTVAVVTVPFSFEGAHRARTAQAGLQALGQQVHTLIQVQNDGLLSIAPRELQLEVAFRVADDVLRQGIQGVTELVTQTGLINLDFANVAGVIRRGGQSLMAIGRGQGTNRVQEAAEAALHHPLLDNELMANATAVLVHVTGGTDLSLQEIDAAMSHITQAAHPSAEVLFGASEDSEMTGRAQLILIATGVHARRRDAIAVRSLFGVPAPADSERDSLPAAVPEQMPSLDVPAFLRRRELFASQNAPQVQPWAAN